jgi:hypothetical protein
LSSIAGFVGLKLAGHFIQPGNPVYLPGAAFFCSATLALVLAIRSFRNVPASAKAVSDAR